MAQSNIEAEIIAALTGQAPQGAAAPQQVQFQQPQLSELDQTGADLQAAVAQLAQGTAPTPMDVPPEVKTRQRIFAAIGDALTARAAGLNPNVKQTDFSGQLRQRRGEREAIIRQNTADQNQFVTGQERREGELEIRRLEGKQNRLQREADRKATEEFQERMAQDARTESGDLRRDLQENDQEFRTGLANMEKRSRERIAGMKDDAFKQELRITRQATKSDSIKIAREIKAGTNKKSAEELLTEFEEDLSVLEVLSDEDRAELRAHFTLHVIGALENRPASDPIRATDPALNPAGFPLPIGAGIDVLERLNTGGFNPALNPSGFPLPLGAILGADGRIKTEE